MTGEQFKRIQERYGWSGRQLSELLTASLGRNVSQTTVSSWRNDKQTIPADVQGFLLGLEENPDPPVDLSDFGIIEHPEDSAPGGGSLPDKKPLVLASTGAYSRVCEEFFELISTAVGMIGAAIGNQTVQRDGLIIHEDKRELGRAWGKLAETNETFRRMLEATDKQGAYLAVALATGTTVGRIWRNHAIPEPPGDNLHGYADTPPPTGPTLVTDAAPAV